MRPDYFHCPTECPKNSVKLFDVRRSKFCDDCDVRLLNEKFKTDVLDRLQLRLGREAKNFKFEKLLETFYFVKSCEDKPPDKITVYTDNLLNVYLIEKEFYDRKIEFQSQN